VERQTAQHHFIHGSAIAPGADAFGNIGMAILSLAYTEWAVWPANQSENDLFSGFREGLQEVRESFVWKGSRQTKSAASSTREVWEFF